MEESSEKAGSRIVPERLSRKRSLISGGVLFVLGFLVVIEGLSYSIGTLARMGPGMLPLILGSLLLLCGALIMVLADTDPEGSQAVVLRPVISILAAMLTFALLVEPAGLIPATAVLVFISCYADPEHTWKSATGLFLVLLALVWIIFVVALGIPFQVLRGVY